MTSGSRRLSRAATARPVSSGMIGSESAQRQSDGRSAA